MIESNLGKYGEGDLRFFVPERKFQTVDRGLISLDRLGAIFGRDMTVDTKAKLIEIGEISIAENLEFLQEPNIHTYTDEKTGETFSSDAQYFREDEDGVLVSYLPPLSNTSEHLHEAPIKERYHVIGGRILVNVGGQISRLENGQTLSIPSDTLHQVRTNLDPALLLIVMENVKGIPRKDWHKNVKNK